MTQARDLANEANSAPGFSPAGTIITFGGTSAPTGYLACDGSAVSRTTYADLFAALSTTWGAGNGSSTFNVPDLRGAFLRGTGSHGTSNMANGNDFAGPSVGSFENDQMQDFAINIPAQSQSSSSGHSNTNALTGSVSGQDNLGNPLYPPVADGVGTPRVGDETRPFNAGVLYCIKT